MRAWQVHRHGEPREALRLAEVAVPEPGPGLLRVRVAASALGLPDLLMCRDAYALTPPTPFTPGQELVGVVTAAGAGTITPVGSRVMAASAFFAGHGGFAEEALALDDFAFPAPEAMDDLEAAGFVIPYHTAHVALVRRARLGPGETLLVLGASGGSGSAAVQLGRERGARVLATVRGPEKAAFCRELGADLAIDLAECDLVEAVREATGGRGADAVFDPVGGDAFQAATRCIAAEGRLLAIGFASGRWGRPSLAHMVQHNYSVLGVIPSGYDRSFRTDTQRELLALHERGAIRVPVGGSWPFEELPDALLHLAGGALGKLVLRVAGGH